MKAIRRRYYYYTPLCVLFFYLVRLTVSAGALFSDLCEYQLGPRGLRFSYLFVLVFVTSFDFRFPACIVDLLVIFLNYLSVCLLVCCRGSSFPRRVAQECFLLIFLFFLVNDYFPALFPRSRRLSSDRKDERRREQETEWLTKRTMNTTICSR